MSVPVIRSDLHYGLIISNTYTGSSSFILPPRPLSSFELSSHILHYFYHFSLSFSFLLISSQPMFFSPLLSLSPPPLPSLYPSIPSLPPSPHFTPGMNPCDGTGVVPTGDSAKRTHTLHLSGTQHARYTSPFPLIF